MTLTNHQLSQAACSGASIDWWFPNIIDEDGEEWMDDGTIYEAFGPTDEFYDRARDVCDMCPIREQCLEHAMEEKERYGMFGGLTPLERRRIERRERRHKRAERLAIEASMEEE